MDKIKNFSLVFTALGALIFGGCAKLDQAVTITPNPIELHGDSVSFKAEAILPVKVLKKGKLYNVEVFYKYGSKKLPIGSVKFTADDFPDSKTVEPKLSKRLSFYYTPDGVLSRGEVMAQGILSKAAGGGKAKKSPELFVVEGCITTSRLVQTSDYVAYATLPMEQKTERTTLSFFFQKGKSVLRKSEMEGEHGKFLDAFVGKEKNVTGSVSIIGSHSPEGAETINTNLSNDRAKVMQNYYRQKMNEYDYKDEIKNSVRFQLTPIVRDWTSFKQGLVKSEVSGEQKSEINAIIDGEGTFEEKEKKLQQLSVYNQLMNAIYPPLRVAHLEILSTKAAKLDSRISLAATDPADTTLSGEELAKAATLTPSLDAKVRIYKNAIDKTDSWQAYNNLGAVYVEMTLKENDKQLLEAINNLEIANKKQESAEAYYNLGIVYMLSNRVSDGLLAAVKSLGFEADEAFSKDINAVKGLLEIKAAKYRKSLKHELR